MNLNDLNELQNLVNRHLGNAKYALQWAKVAADIRNSEGVCDAEVSMSIPGFASYEAMPIRARLQEMVRGHLPAMLRAIEFEELAKAKRESLAADLLEAQINAAIITPPQASAHSKE